MTARLITADASKVSPHEFMETVFPGFAERRAESRRKSMERCICAVKRGDTYGWSPLMVADARQIIAERDSLVERDFGSAVVL